MSENKFKAGDRVRLKENGAIVTVVIAKDGWIAHNENRRIGGVCPMEEAEPIDSKTAFLSELKELLEKYDAKIEAYSDNIEPVIMEIHIGGTSIEFGESSNFLRIGYDNIMDYDKE